MEKPVFVRFFVRCSKWLKAFTLSKQPMRASNISMFHPGEVTLTGRVLPIGGVKEKSLAARRSGVKTLIFPKANKYDYDELTGDSISQENSIF